MSQETIIELSKTIAALSEEKERWKAHSKAQDDHYAAGVKALQAESDGYFNERNAALSKLQEAKDTIGALRLHASKLKEERDAFGEATEKLKDDVEMFSQCLASCVDALWVFKSVRFPKSRRKGITIEVETVAGSKRRFTFTNAADRAHAIFLAHQTIYLDEAKAGGGSF